MVAPATKVVHNKSTTAILRFINNGSGELKNELCAALKKAQDTNVSRAEIIDRLKCAFFLATVPAVITERSAALGVAPFVLKLLYIQIDKVDWEYILNRFSRPSPELN